MTTRNPSPLVSYQPLRLLFQLSYIFTILLRLPYYTVISLVPSLRPIKKWTAKQTFMTRVSYWILDSISRVGITETLSLAPGKEGTRFQIILALRENFCKGPLESETVKPAKIGGTWFPDAPAAGEDITSMTIVLYLHGGAFVQGDGRTATCGPIARYFLDKGSCDAVFALQYRLSGHEDLNPFPAALQDALAGYLFLLNELHVPARQIIFAGDSAGGALATSLLRYISEFGSNIDIPTPKCAVLLSPWVEPFYNDPTDNPHYGTDFVPSNYGVWGARAYAGSTSATDPYITPLGHPFPTPVPLFVNAGSAELFYERINRFAEEMSDVKGNVVELYSEDGAPHDTFFVAGLMGFEESAWKVAAKVKEFVRKCE